MILLIGYGNDLRRDDGAGLILAEMIERVWQAQVVTVKRLSVHQLTPELALEIARPEVTAVVFADARAVISNTSEPRIQTQALKIDLKSPPLGHHLDPTTLLIYVNWLYNCQPPAWLVTVPGIDFGYGQGLSQMTQKALAVAQPVAIELLAQLQTVLVMKQGESLPVKEGTRKNVG